LRDQLRDLCARVPRIPADEFAATANNGTTELASNFPQAVRPCQYDKKAIYKWADDMQTVVDDFQMIHSCVGPATYVWGTDRSGAAEQNLSLLMSEFSRSLDQITSRVSARIELILVPAASLRATRMEITKHDNVEIRQNYYGVAYEDTDSYEYCFTNVARNAKGMRQVILANFDKTLQAINDYLQAQHKDGQHDSRGFVY
jgi:hypothetical protein